MNKWFNAWRANKYFRNGTKLMSSEKQGQAIVEFNKAIAMDPALLDAYLQRGIAYVVTRERERGVADLDFLLSRKPDIAAAYYWKSVAHLQLKEIDLAFEDINPAIQLDPNEPANYLIRGLLYTRKQQYDLALRDMTTAIELGFEEEGYNNRAIVFEEKGDDAAAVADWTKVIQLAPDEAKAYCRRGILYSEAGQIEQSIKDLEIGLKFKGRLTDTLRRESEDLLKRLKTSTKEGK